MRSQDLSGEVLDKRYQIVERLSEGAMGVVYRGVRLKLDRAVAIKVMHSSLPGAMEGRRRFEREAKLMARLEHPHCVSIIDYGVHVEKPYVVMELVRGRSLADVLEQERFTIARALDVMRQVLSGLVHAHEHGIIHRDIKPANIMVTPKAPLGDHVRILDFGLARLLGGSNSLSQGVAVGTPSYMAPEQCRGEQVDATADIYSCGVMLFEMLTGEKPFSARDPISIVRKHIAEAPPRLSDVRPQDFGPLEAVVARALAKAPADRFPTAIAMAEALDASPPRVAEPTMALPMSEVEVIEPSVEVPITVGSSVTQRAADSTQLADEIVAELQAQTVRAEAGRAEGPQLVTAADNDDSDPSASAAIGTSDEAVSGASSRAAARSGAAPSPRRASHARFIVIVVAMLGLAAVIGIVVAMLGDDDKVSPAARREARADAKTDVAADPVHELVAAAEQQVGSGKLESAIDMLQRARRRFPNRAELPLLLGKLYFSKLWWNYGLVNLREAMRIDPALERDPELLKTALRGFISTPSYDDRLAKLIIDLGSPMIPLLEETARSHPKAEVRSRSANLLRKLR